MKNFWQNCLSQLELELTPQQFSAWIKPLVPLDYNDSILRIAAPNRFKLDWVKTQYADRITALASQFLDASVEVQFILNPQPRTSSPARTVSPVSGTDSSSSENSPVEINHKVAAMETPVREQSRINAEMTFDSFVTGKANQLAGLRPFR